MAARCLWPRTKLSRRLGRGACNRNETPSSGRRSITHPVDLLCRRVRAPEEVSKAARMALSSKTTSPAVARDGPQIEANAKKNAHIPARPGQQRKVERWSARGTWFACFVRLPSELGAGRGGRHALNPAKSTSSLLFSLRSSSRVSRVLRAAASRPSMQSRQLSLARPTVPFSNRSFTMQL